MTKILITSALPYINGVKHLGNLVGSMLPADVYARFCRARGDEVLYICATDEHGTPAELAAHEAGLPVERYCREQHEIQKNIYAGFGLSFDHFGRSSSPQNHALTQHFCDALDRNGFIEEHEIRQVYSKADGRFLPDRYIVGTCPKCGYDRARGDQCENCASVLDPTDLIEPRSAISGSTDLEVRDSRHLFLTLPKMEQAVTEWIDSKTDWPLLVTSIARKWIKEGLRERCITRDLAWGVPVNRPGFENKVFYVWFDAPIEYISATREWADAAPPGETRDWEAWWKNADDIRYVQFMAKDNIPFHTISFPATVMGSGEPWKLVDYIKGFNWLTFYGGKFSTSQGRGVFTDAALDLYPADYWRYWLMANAPESGDSSFTFDSFAGMVNKDLADVLGNFVNRCLKFTAARFGETVPEGGTPGPEEQALCDTLDGRLAAYTGFMEQTEFRKALAELRAIWVEGNNYLARTEPWTAIKTDRDRAAVILRTAINLIRVYGKLSAPIVPDLAATLLGAVHVPEDVPAWPDRKMADELAVLPPGHPFSVPAQLVTKISDEAVAELSARYGGVSEPVVGNG